MSVLGKIFSSAASGLIGEIGKIVDDTVTTDEERAKAKHRIKKTINNFKLSMEEQVTKRHAADMMSDSWLSKNIRPLSLVFTTTMVTLFAFTDGNIADFTISSAYISLFKAIMMAQYTFYFGSRALEKYNAINASRDVEKEMVRQGKNKNTTQFQKVNPEEVNF